MQRFLNFKTTLILSFLVGMLLTLNTFVFHGNFSKAGQKHIGRPARAVASSPAREDESKLNLRITAFHIERSPTELPFRQGEKLTLSCSIENTSSKAVQNFSSVIRTPEKEIAFVKTAVLQPGQKTVLTGTFLPEKTGVHIFACRADVENHIAESDENDNREIRTLYITEAQETGE